MHSVNTNGEAADREEQEILHHDDTEKEGKEGKERSEEGGVGCGGERWGEGRGRREESGMGGGIGKSRMREKEDRD